MNILINDTDKLGEVKKEFSRHFPYLKIEFFDVDPKSNPVFTPDKMIGDNNKLISDIRHIHTPVHISINGNIKVCTLEEKFKKEAGLFVQVFRKSGKTWLETTKTDDWTLSEQNKKGEEMSKPVPADDKEDYHEQE